MTTIFYFPWYSYLGYKYQVPGTWNRFIQGKPGGRFIIYIFAESIESFFKDTPDCLRVSRSEKDTKLGNLVGTINIWDGSTFCCFVYLVLF